MDRKRTEALLYRVQRGDISPQDAAEELCGETDLAYVNIDWERKERTGEAEVIYGEGKTAEQLVGIVQKMLLHRQENILVTRLSREKFETLLAADLPAVYYDTARIAVVNSQEKVKAEGIIAVVAAGTSDMPVAEEAAVTAEVMGNRVMRIYDVGVAGIHRLLTRVDDIQKARVVICVAGMEGALASVVGGLVRVPVIAVPTSVGYGASFGGLSALLCMLNSCASGVGVVNIDNGFGAGYLASTINQNR